MFSSIIYKYMNKPIVITVNTTIYKVHISTLDSEKGEEYIGLTNVCVFF